MRHFAVGRGARCPGCRRQGTDVSTDLPSLTDLALDEARISALRERLRDAPDADAQFLLDSLDDVRALLGSLVALGVEAPHHHHRTCRWDGDNGPHLAGATCPACELFRRAKAVGRAPTVRGFTTPEGAWLILPLAPSGAPDYAPGAPVACWPAPARPGRTFSARVAWSSRYGIAVRWTSAAGEQTETLGRGRAGGERGDDE